jgi:hypothetical protein
MVRFYGICCMIAALYHTILAIPVTHEASPLEPVFYTVISIVFPIALMFFLKKTEKNKNHGSHY